MKKIILLIGLAMLTISCKAQQIIPLEKFIEYRDSQSDIADGTYLQDVNGLLNKYLGTWKGTYDNKNYTFIVTKVKRDVRGIFIDELLVRYVITSSSGAVIEDTRSLPDNDPLVIEGDYISKSLGYYTLNYFSRADCAQNGVLFISLLKNTTSQMRLYLSLDTDMIDGNKCPTIPVPIFPVKNDLILTKQ